MFNSFLIVLLRDRRSRTTLKGVALALALALALPLSSTHCELGDRDRSVGQAPVLDVPERMAAARRGIDWLLAHADDMPAGWALPFLLRLHRVAPNDELATRIEEVLRDGSAPSRRVELPVNFRDPRILQPFRMTPILFELMRRKAFGEAYEKDLNAVRQAIEGNGGRFWDRVKPLQRSVYLYQFADLGLTPPYDFDSLYASFQREVAARSIEDVAKDPPALYMLTHLMIVRSMYLQKYIEDDEFDILLPYMMHALSKNLSGKTTTSRLDISAEILTCLSLMRAPDDERIAAARRMLIAAQKPDGSWGEASASMRQRVHATLVGVLGTIVFPENLRLDPDLTSRPVPP